MGKKIRKFPSINSDFNFMGEEERVYRDLREESFKNTKFINKKDDLDFDESLKLLAKFMVTKDKEFIEKAYEKSPYNIAAKIYILLNQDLVPFEKLQDVKNLYFETTMYPIKGNPSFRNDFNKFVFQYLITFFKDNKMCGEIPYISYMWINFGHEKLEFDKDIFDVIKIFLEIDAADSFYNLYDKFPPAFQKEEVVLLAKIVFDIRRMDEKGGIETLSTLKYINPKIEQFLDVAEYENPYDEDEFIDLMLRQTKVGELMEFVVIGYVMQYLIWANSKVRVGEQLNKKIKARSVSIESMKDNPIYKNITSQVLNALKKVGLVTKKDFLSVPEQYLLNEVDNVGKKSIEQLKENGVKFKKEGR